MQRRARPGLKLAHRASDRLATALGYVLLKLAPEISDAALVAAVPEPNDAAATPGNFRHGERPAGVGGHCLPT
jgi:hypothetical protein